MSVAAPVLGILEAGENRPELIARHGTYVDFFKRYFGQHDGALAFDSFAVFSGELPTAAEQCEGYIVTGSRHSSYDDFTWIADLKAFVRDTAEVRPVSESASAIRSSQRPSAAKSPNRPRAGVSASTTTRSMNRGRGWTRGAISSRY